jgi:uncharacterized damage-inducible protein DinB
MDLRYPIGKFDFDASVAPEMRPLFIDQIASAPTSLRESVRALDDDQLDTPYRPGGWTVRQTVHHVADSHLNSYIRLRLALTEEQPLVKAYDEKKWAELVDARTLPVEISLSLLDTLHQRWVVLLKSMSDADFARTFRHPAVGLFRLDMNVALYAWHGRHHTAHITGLRQRNGWQ